MSSELFVHIIVNWVYPLILVGFFFGLTIFIHEFGHFWVAKRRGMRIDRFSIGFGPKIFGWKRDGIEYRVAWLPFGGYVALPQMTPAELIEGRSEQDGEPLPPASPSTKILVALAGPVFNVGMAVVLAALVWWLGVPMPVNTPVIGWVEPNSAEEQAGLRPGDRVVSVNGKPVKTWTDVITQVAMSLEPSVELVVARGGQERRYVLETENHPRLGVKTINLYGPGRPYARKILPNSAAERAGVARGDRFLSVEGVPVHSAEQLRDLIGRQADKPTQVKVLRKNQTVSLTVSPQYDPAEKAARMGVVLGEELELQRPGPSIGEQFHEVFAAMGQTLYMLSHARQTGVGPGSLSGPVGIAGGWWFEIASGGIMRGVRFAVMINIALAIFNLLPIPVLDGGHIFLSVIEAIRRKPVNARLVQAAWTGSAAVIITFMVYVTFHDILRFLPWNPKSVSPPASSQPATEPQP